MQESHEIPQSMKAISLFEIGKFEVVEKEIRALKGDELLIKVAACGICGSDLPRIYELGTRVYPVVLGHEFSGTVVKAAKDEDQNLIGKNVAIFPLIPCRKCDMCLTGHYAQCRNYNYLGSRSDGGFAEYCIVPSKFHLVFSYNPSVSLEDLSLVEPATVAQHALRVAGLSNGQSILIVGAGSIGIMMARWAKLFGADVITLVDVLDEKIQFAQARGLDIYNSLKIDLAEMVNDKTNNKGFDIVIEGTGISGGFKTAINSIRNFGSIALLGNPHKDTVIELKDHSTILRKEIRLTGIWNSYYNEFPFNEWEYTVKCIDAGKLKVDDLVTHRSSLENLPELTRQIYQREITICKAIYSADCS